MKIWEFGQFDNIFFWVIENSQLVDKKQVAIGSKFLIQNVCSRWVRPGQSSTLFCECLDDLKMAHWEFSKRIGLEQGVL